jgi:photosystem II stability/assembly factor-like uncharacterized protein
MRLAKFMLAAFALATVAAQKSWRIERSRLATILLGVSFVDENFGYVSGAQNGVGALMLQTRDGGQNYVRVPLETQAPPAVGMYLSTHAASRFSAATAGLCGFCFEASGIQYTIDGAQFRLANDPSPIFPPVVGIQGGSHVANAVRGTYGFVGQFGENYAVAHTSDGGNSWQRAPLEYRNAWARYMHMPSANTWYVTAGTWPRDDKAGPRGLFEKMNVIVNETFSEVQFDFEALGETPSRKLLQGGGYRTAILKTSDAGRTWETVFENLDNDYYLNDIFCTSENTCYAVGDGSRGVGIRTTNGGATWTEFLSLPGRNMQVMGVKFGSPREGFIAAAALSQQEFVGQMYYTNDSGESWTRMDIPGVAPVSISLYYTANGIGGHGTALTPDGQSSTIVYR